MTNNKDSAVNFANDTSESFVESYYKAYDLDREKVSQLYRPSSAIVYNGTPVQGVENVHNLFMSIPASQHEIQSWDTHPIQDVITPNAPVPPSILLNVTGLVAHGAAAINALSDGKSLGSKKNKEIILLPRTFSQNFILRNENDNWFIISDCFRFVG
ncbi:NTF2-related export protein 1 [Wallemia ichthyophaga EXF-994]|uniref:NTF2-related export protein 1 n=1 Tax=Wallemia ichthyophaga (strain EXF-994 / CBS 113033) TaxID=1299270 RepID=R9APG7_WALI9|nr:NTF2-related export protein 1 [Wallemia ichthyophaga EXF-994]EOR01996.1 NTF2-related export protein 1 [Wallemia ichthyophaga EXF-994]